MAAERIEQLKPHGVTAHYAEIWGGEVGKGRGKRTDHSHITGALFTLTPEEWCYICQRESDGYIGPCCGNTGQMQDIINGVFRDSGYIDGSSLIQLGVNAESHEGFETFVKDLSDQQFAAYVARWDDLDPWDKIGLVYQAVKDKVRWGYIDRPNLEDFPREQEDETGQKRTMRILENGLTSLGWADLFSRDDEFLQQHANRIVRLARILEPARIVADQLAEDVTIFEGAGIVNRESGEVITNGYGYCIYSDAGEAERMLELMTRWEREEREEGDDPVPHPEDAIGDRVEIRPVRVSVAGGIEVLPAAVSR